MRYEYDVEVEGFRRVDRLGRILKININEGRRIASLVDLGYTDSQIHEMMIYTRNVKRSTTTTFIKNLKEGNINLEGDYPAPTKVMEHMDMESRISELEEKVNWLIDRIDDSENEGKLKKYFGKFIK